MAAAEIASAAISAAATLASGAASGGISASMNKKTRQQQQKQWEQQMAFAREQWDWQKYAAENAYQISVADAEKAGLSPLAAMDMGTSAATSANGVGQPSIPEGMSYTPDMNTIMDSVRSSAEMLSRGMEEYGRNKRNTEDLSAQMDQLIKRYENESLLLAEKGQQEMSRLTATLAAASWSSDSSQQHETNIATIEGFKSLTGGYVPRTKYYTDEDDYNRARLLFDTKLQPILDEYSQMVNVESASAAEAGGKSETIGANGSINLLNTGAGYGANKSTSENESASSSHFYNKTDNNRAWFITQLQKANIVLPLMKTPSHF